MIILYLLAFVSLVISQQLPLLYPVTYDSYISSSNVNQNYGTLNNITISRSTIGLVQYSLDASYMFKDIAAPPVGFTTTLSPGFQFNCNHWGSIIGGKSWHNITSVSGCPAIGCQLQASTMVSLFDETTVTNNCPSNGQTTPECVAEWSASCPGVSNSIGSVTVHNGQTGLISFDITSVLKTVEKGSLTGLNLALMLTSSHPPAIITLASRESGYGSFINITNPQQPVDEQCPRKYVNVPFNTNYINVSYVDCVSSLSGPVHLMIHPMPAYSYAYARSIGPAIASGINGRVIAMDLGGTGFSEHVLDSSVFNMSVQSQALLIKNFLNQLGVTSLHIYSQEFGSLPAMYFAAANPSMIRSASVNQGSYLRPCPPWQISSLTNIPPNGVGICQNNTLVPPPYWPFWSSFYLSYASACEFWGYSFFDVGIVKFMSPNPDPAVVNNYLLPYIRWSMDQNCSLNRLMEYPRHAPSNAPFVPAEVNQATQFFNEFFLTSTIPLQIVNADMYPGSSELGLGTYSEYFLTLRNSFPNAEISCVGTYTSHFFTDDVPFNFIANQVSFINAHL